MIKPSIINQNRHTTTMSPTHNLTAKWFNHFGWKVAAMKYMVYVWLAKTKSSMPWEAWLEPMVQPSEKSTISTNTIDLLVIEWFNQNKWTSTQLQQHGSTMYIRGWFNHLNKLLNIIHLNACKLFVFFGHSIPNKFALKNFERP